MFTCKIVLLCSSFVKWLWSAFAQNVKNLKATETLKKDLKATERFNLIYTFCVSWKSRDTSVCFGSRDIKKYIN